MTKIIFRISMKRSFLFFTGFLFSSLLLTGQTRSELSDQLIKELITTEKVQEYQLAILWKEKYFGNLQMGILTSKIKNLST